MKLSVIIPCYNEKDHLPELISRVKNAPLENKEIILVDDGSTDGTTERIKADLEKEVDKSRLPQRESGERSRDPIGAGACHRRHDPHSGCRPRV